MAIAVGSNDEPYVSGYLWGQYAFGPTALTSSTFSSAIFVGKLSAAGQWQWAVKADSYGPDRPTALAVSGNVACLTGGYSGTAIFGNQTLPNAQSVDGYVASLNATTGQWV